MKVLKPWIWNNNKNFLILKELKPMVLKENNKRKHKKVKCHKDHQWREEKELEKKVQVHNMLGRSLNGYHHSVIKSPLLSLTLILALIEWVLESIILSMISTTFIHIKTINANRVNHHIKKKTKPNEEMNNKTSSLSYLVHAFHPIIFFAFL